MSLSHFKIDFPFLSQNNNAIQFFFLALKLDTNLSPLFRFSRQSSSFLNENSYSQLHLQMRSLVILTFSLSLALFRREKKILKPFTRLPPPSPFVLKSFSEANKNLGKRKNKWKRTRERKRENNCSPKRLRWHDIFTLSKPSLPNLLRRSEFQCCKVLHLLNSNTLY